MTAGRPTSYTEDMPEKVEEYLLQYAELGHVIPTHAGLARHLGITKETIRAWNNDEEKKDFSVSLSHLKEEQELKLLAHGLDGKYNPTIAKLGLASNHGYHDKQDTKHSGGIDLTGKSEDELDAIIASDSGA